MDKKFMVYSKIREMKAAGFSQRKIAKHLGVSRSTVAKYHQLTCQEFTAWLASTKHRSHKLEGHKERILNWLRTYPDLSASQIHDWLEERGFNTISESTLRRYVKQLREDYDLPKHSHPRQYEAIPDPPMGEQAQIDFGQIWVPTVGNETIKLYVVAIVLSHSRYKYMEWWDRPYTTQDVIRAHEHAFQFFGGKPRTIVYDQDRTLIVDENYGEIVFTSAFEAYRQTQPFQVHACRGFDPESKGRIENVIGFVKSNFAKNRLYTDLASWNEQALAWLRRKGNGKVHNTTKRVPLEVFKEERTKLLPVMRQVMFPNLELTLRQVAKDNTIKYKANRYSVPIGTYGRLTEVSVTQADGKLRIVDPDMGELIATHRIDTGHGKLIKNRNHERDQSTGIDELAAAVSDKFSDQQLARTYLGDIRAHYPRYIRDQLHLIETLFKKYPIGILNQTLIQCSEKRIISATGFRDVASN